MPSWNDPSNSQPDHVNVLKNLADKDTYAVTMGQNTAGYTDLPNGTMNVDNAQKLLRRLEAGSFEVFTLSIAGGGTGANNAAGIRSNINVSETGVGASQVRTNSQNDLRYPLKANALSDMDALDAFNNIKQSATTTSSGVVEEATSTEMENGVSGKFPDAATIKDYTFNPSNASSGQNLELVWSGSDTSIDLDTIPGGYPGDGFYVISGGGHDDGTIYSSSGLNTSSVVDVGRDSSFSYTYGYKISSSKVLTGSRIRSDGAESSLTFTRIYKVI